MKQHENEGVTPNVKPRYTCEQIEQAKTLLQVAMSTPPAVADVFFQFSPHVHGVFLHVYSGGWSEHKRAKEVIGYTDDLDSAADELAKALEPSLTAEEMRKEALRMRLKALEMSEEAQSIERRAQALTEAAETLAKEVRQ